MGGGTVIRGFLQILGPQRGRMYSYLAVASLYGVLHGLAMVLLVPISVALFDADYGAAGRWLGLLAVLVVFASMANYVQATLAIRMAMTTMRLLHHRLGDHMVGLPLGWFSRETVGKVSQIAVKGTVFVGTSGGNLLTPRWCSTSPARPRWWSVCSSSTGVSGWSRSSGVCCSWRAGGSHRA
jgi:ATP-binding cassette, subfamily B, bacterial IrtB/YbtQ